MLLLRARVTVELAEKSIAVLFGPVGQLLDEVLNRFARGPSQSLCAAEVDGIGLHEFGIEFVLANKLAHTVPNLRACAISVPICVLWRELLVRVGNCSKFLDRADPD